MFKSYKLVFSFCGFFAATRTKQLPPLRSPLYLLFFSLPIPLCVPSLLQFTSSLSSTFFPSPHTCHRSPDSCSLCIYSHKLLFMVFTSFSLVSFCFFPFFLHLSLSYLLAIDGLHSTSSILILLSSIFLSAFLFPTLSATYPYCLSPFLSPLTFFVLTHITIPFPFLSLLLTKYLKVLISVTFVGFRYPFSLPRGDSVFSRLIFQLPLWQQLKVSSHYDLINQLL